MLTERIRTEVQKYLCEYEERIEALENEVLTLKEEIKSLKGKGFKIRKTKGVYVLESGDNIINLDDEVIYVDGLPRKPSTVYRHKNNIMSWEWHDKTIRFSTSKVEIKAPVKIREDEKEIPEEKEPKNMEEWECMIKEWEGISRDEHEKWYDSLEEISTPIHVHTQGGDREVVCKDGARGMGPLEMDYETWARFYYVRCAKKRAARMRRSHRLAMIKQWEDKNYADFNDWDCADERQHREWYNIIDENNVENKQRMFFCQYKYRNKKGLIEKWKDVSFEDHCEWLYNNYNVLKCEDYDEWKRVFYIIHDGKFKTIKKMLDMMGASLSNTENVLRCCMVKVWSPPGSILPGSGRVITMVVIVKSYKVTNIAKILFVGDV
ncbi:hypothetical protein K439DRAFT_1518807 [Ramaria rubella]|nr:hypothetical protein K439DRAFT_1518807 [Ramaria rubella]